MKFAIFALAILAFPLLGEAKMILTPHIADVLPHIDEDTWVLVDLDNTLYEAKQALGHANWVYDEVSRRMQNGHSFEDAIRDFHKIWIPVQDRCPVKPLEEHFVPSLLALQARGIVIMGLTHRPPTVAPATLRQVASLGFDFIMTAPSGDSFAVPAAHPTLYIQGILFVSDFNKKSDVLLPFLTRLNKRPKKIVFIDDKMKNVEDLERSFSNSDIDFIGVHYTAIEHAPPVYSRELAEFQYQYNDRVLSNEEALSLMKRSTDSN